MLNSKDFVYWLDGYLAQPDLKELNGAQTKILVDKLGQCFSKVTPVLNPELYFYGHYDAIPVHPITGIVSGCGFKPLRESNVNWGDGKLHVDVSC